MLWRSDASTNKYVHHLNIAVNIAVIVLFFNVVRKIIIIFVKRAQECSKCAKRAKIYIKNLNFDMFKVSHWELPFNDWKRPIWRKKIGLFFFCFIYFIYGWLRDFGRSSVLVFGLFGLTSHTLSKTYVNVKVRSTAQHRRERDEYDLDSNIFQLLKTYCRLI